MVWQRVYPLSGIKPGVSRGVPTEDDPCKAVEDVLIRNSLVSGMMVDEVLCLGTSALKVIECGRKNPFPADSASHALQLP